MSPKQYLVTGGTGFLGSATVKRLVADGHRVRVLDNGWRGSAHRLADVAADVEMVEADVRDAEAVRAAVRGVDAVLHLAAINGTRFFYTEPRLVLEVAIKGTLNVLDACDDLGVGDLLLFSSSEVYQTPPAVPTDESVPLTVPDPLEPRYSYGGGKIASELLALNYGRTGFDRVVIVRPHNVYGPDMGWEHVIPQLVLRMHALSQATTGTVRLPIQGDGEETRAFNFVADFVNGLVTVLEAGSHLGIYHIGATEEVAIRELAAMVGRHFGREVEIVPGEPAAGGTRRRCPNIEKVSALGYRPEVPLAEGLKTTAQWYVDHAGEAPSSGMNP